MQFIAKHADSFELKLYSQEGVHPSRAAVAARLEPSCRSPFSSAPSPEDFDSRFGARSRAEFSRSSLPASAHSLAL